MESEDGCKSVLQKTNYINVDERYVSDEELFSHVGPDNTIGQRRANYVKASPNPLEDQILKIEWYGDYDKIEIISSYGIPVKTILLDEAEKENKTVEIKLEGIQAGIYTILINGKNQSQTKLIKL